MNKTDTGEAIIEDDPETAALGHVRGWARLSDEVDDITSLSKSSMSYAALTPLTNNAFVAQFEEKGDFDDCEERQSFAINDDNRGSCQGSNSSPPNGSGDRLIKGIIRLKDLARQGSVTEPKSQRNRDKP